MNQVFKMKNNAGHYGSEWELRTLWALQDLILSGDFSVFSASRSDPCGSQFSQEKGLELFWFYCWGPAQPVKSVFQPLSMAGLPWSENELLPLSSLTRP